MKSRLQSEGIAYEPPPHELVRAKPRPRARELTSRVTAALSRFSIWLGKLQGCDRHHARRLSAPHKKKGCEKVLASLPPNWRCGLPGGSLKSSQDLATRRPNCRREVLS